MSRHQRAINRYLAIIFSIPVVLAVETLSYTTSYTRPFMFWIGPANLFFGSTFIFAGLIALLFELPFTQPDMLGSSRGGKFGTGLVAAVGIAFLIYAALIFSGYYNITTDTGIGNFFLTYIILPVMIGMFSLETYETLVHQRRFAIHRYVKA